MTKQYGMVVDLDTCIGCGLCVTACKQERSLSPNVGEAPGTLGIAVNQVLDILEGTYPDLSMQYFYLQCMHCKNPPCREACPIEGAIYQREDGVVLINEEKCDGCKNRPEGPRCIPACPYEVIQFSDKESLVKICNLCVHLIDAGIEPACVRACPAETLIFGDLNDPDSKPSKALKAARDRAFILKPEKGTNPCVQHIKPEGVSLDRVANIGRAQKLYGFK